MLRTAMGNASSAQSPELWKNSSRLMIEVASELLKNSDVREQAGRPGWSLIADEFDTDRIQRAFAEMLITAVTLDWDEDLQPYCPRRTIKEVIYRAVMEQTSNSVARTA
ncbi:hypothetical protein Pmar_PMAR007766 [Perkinsus marinus ATCC 50983]|uniref:Uncharacterized protein n=1 Tax=Perkinsus marinus (strain ATCC 50983 / TXsc) TaxID=423536 RepID=C5KYT0_PERM5|nr:hypothetical protein Pmar_PMAR007766 [Perkinsus marinus ATCC 50983]EER10358.1 hypothetical protein Pmar_PMAR007766 [Perkinsus marinus ATCC 50983]|eukprot:XP_002778563.1 hypothetical protein Pmar_PMAR007766 [Perkinsus marinus ATCC 50983]